MKENKSLTKIIATFMAFIITFIAMPTQAIALYIDDSEILEETVVAENNSEVEQAEVFIVEEDASKRGQFEKHYLCSDGTYISVTYPEAVHYLDNNQVWQDVDQSLTYDSKTGTYKSEKADFKVSFSETFSSTNIAQIERNGYSLSWGIQTAKKTAVEKTEIASVKPNIMETESTEIVITPSLNAQAQVISTPTVEFDNFSDRLISREDSFALPDISSQISYSDVLNGSESVSVRYTVYHNKIEEDIIISDRGDIRSVSMNMDIGTLTPIVNADGSVDLVDAYNVMQFRIGIPYMMDADFSVCNDISVTAEKVGSNCIITYTPDLEWFSSEDRAFPIVLDPSVTTNDYVSNIEDTYVEQNSTANHTSEQYLQIYPNGTNRRNAVVRITKLPVIDESMPIVSARLTLTSQFASFSNVNLKAEFYYSSVDLDEYSYGLTTAALFEYTAYSSLNAGTTAVAFDVSSYIYEMYANEQLHDEYGYNDLYGDFIIGYASDTDTTHLSPFFSSEYTVPANRPVFTVRYGYTLPAGILNGGNYSFRNYSSYSYMSVNGTNPANNSNIYQLKNDSNVALTTQKFKLEYVSETGGYLLRSLSSSSGTDKVVSINRNGGEISGGQNVRLSSPSDSISQEWLIIPVDYDVFKIVPRANMNYALTAYFYSDGSNTGTGALSAGNIFIQTYSGSDNFQHWYVYDNSNNQLDTSQYRADVETGDYYISNAFTGKYLHRSTTVANCISSTIDDVGETTVKWKIVNLGDGYCTIQRSDLPSYYLVPINNADGSGIRIYNGASETIPDSRKWSIRLASGGGYLIQNKATGYYLSATNSTNDPSSVSVCSLNSVGTDDYEKQIWRIAPEDDYVELDHRVSFNDLVIDPGEPKAASINKKPSNAYWANYTDFDYTITSGSEYVSYDESTHKLTGIKRDSDSSAEPAVATVTATHKTTGLSNTFTIKVNNNAIIVIPGIFGSELYMGDDNPYFKSGTAIVSQDMLNKIAEFGENTTLAQAIALVGVCLLNPSALIGVSSATVAFANMFYDSIKCNNDGSSKYEVYTKKYVYVEPDYDEDGNPIYTLPSNYDSQYYSPHAGLLDTYYDLIDALYSDETITSRYSIEFFSYDWRLSNAVSAERLDAFIEECGYDKVVLVAHSMGGLVASGYMALGDTQTNKVKEVYMLSSPLEGTPEVINVWANKDFSFLSGDAALGPAVDVILTLLTFSLDPLQKLFGNYASIYELFPTQNFISVSGTPYLTHSTSSSPETVCSTYSASMEVLSDCLSHFNSDLMSGAEAFHASCRKDNRHITYSVDSTYMYATGKPTTTQLRCSESLLSCQIEIKTTSTLGDGLVPNCSATLGRSGSVVKEYTGDHMYVIQGNEREGLPVYDLISSIKGG